MKAAESQTEEAFWSYRAAGSLPNLTLAGNYAGGNNLDATNNGRFQDVYVELQQTFGPIGSIGLAGKEGFQNWRISKMGLEEVRISLIQDVKNGFYTLLFAQEALAEAEENLKLADKLYDFARKKRAAGAAPETDLLNAEIQKAAFEQAVIQAQGALKQAEAALNPLLGRPASASLQVAGTPELTPLNSDFESLLGLAQKNRPLLKEVRLSVEAAETGVELAKSEARPTPTLFYTYDLATAPLYTFGASLQFPIFDYGQIKNQVNVEEKAVAAKQNTLHAAFLSVSSSVKSAYEAYRAAYENASTFREQVLTPSEKLMEITQYGYREGALPYLQVVVAEQNLKTARSQYIALLLAGHQAMDALEAAVGQPLEAGTL